MIYKINVNKNADQLILHQIKKKNKKLDISCFKTNRYAYTRDTRSQKKIILIFLYLTNII
jgi:hypothetical protein